MKKKTLVYTSIFILLIVMALLLLRSCQSQIEMPWGVWQAISEKVRQHPDHLPAELERKIAEGQPEGLFAFIRDQIATLPPIQGYNRNPAYRWGEAGVLRTGQGTSLEKSLLLRSVLTRLDIPAEIYRGRLDGFTVSEVYQTNTLDFPSQVAVSKLRRAQQKHGLKPWSTTGIVHTDSTIENVLPNLEAFIQDKHRIREVDWAQSLRYTYPIRAMIDSQWVFLNPAIPTAQWGRALLYWKTNVLYDRSGKTSALA